MKAVVLFLAVLVAILNVAFGFAPVSSVSRTSSRASTIVMDGKTRALRDRIKSVKNTRRITEAMRLVAAARVRRAQEAVLQTRPFIATLQKSYRVVLNACTEEDLELPILEVRDVKKVSLVLVTGDRGLCGSFNSAIIKAATRRINKLQEQGIEVQLILVGRKGEQWFGRRKIPISGTFVLGSSPNPEVCTNLANFLIAQFLTKEIDAAEIIYTRFNNLISSEPSIRTLLPLSVTGIESEDDEIFKLTTDDGKMVVKRSGEEKKPEYFPDYIFEDEPAKILNTLLTLFFGGNILRCLQESVASELASRMTAMQSASNNAQKITTVLGQVYNRARQASVTQEMLEIVAGASTVDA